MDYSMFKENGDMATRVICVCGTTCVGKGHYCEQLIEDYRARCMPRPVLLQQGKFFRNTLGPEFFEKLDEPDAPAVTEHWVRSLITFSVTIAVNNQRDVILDGFPRTPLQFDWLMLSSEAATLNLSIDMRFLWAAEGAIEDRVQKRLREDPSEEKLLVARLKRDATQLAAVYSVVKNAEKQHVYDHLLPIQEITV